ncbi:DUF3147 family protein [Reinekea blandensis]|uniref:DUF3147 family protein n=1 Tax=Reinekea blandensis MED297 TaxID=314283 RepID=A4B9P2_9GAMM|nr:DUF3147 family protein [Reinekea blandensis]EAR11343.1 hypothetical protein MED297_20687 [Reinekea sp. MED297] [Reinekea blandensis MED297]
MGYYLLKVGVTAVLVVLISEIAKRSSLMGAILASIPLTSVLAMIWLYIDTGSVRQVSALASSVFWLVIPSLSLFIALPLLLQRGINFYLSLVIAISLTALTYGLMVVILRKFGLSL